MKASGTQSRVTLTEVLVLICVSLVICSTSIPPGVGLNARSAETKALSNAKQIGLACRTFAVDNDGQYPTYTLMCPERSQMAPTTCSTTPPAIGCRHPMPS
jgi:hypothetical protein